MRRVHVNGEVYTYRVGKQSLVIRLPSGKSVCVGCAEVKGDMTPDDFDRGKWKSTSDGMILPSEVSKYIEEHIVARNKTL